jgi:hypothetical protein
MAGPALPRDRFSVGGVLDQLLTRTVPAAKVPTQFAIFRINRYFPKPAVLIGNRPCKLAAILQLPKKGRSIGHTEHFLAKKTRIRPENNGGPLTGIRGNFSPGKFTDPPARPRYSVNGGYVGEEVRGFWQVLPRGSVPVAVSAKLFALIAGYLTF